MTLPVVGASSPPLRVLVVPDTFKGTLPAATVADVVATEWRRCRPEDSVRALPLADGGEGTVAAWAAGSAGELHRSLVRGTDGRYLTAPWLELDDGVAVVELAACCGLPLMRVHDPLGADTAPLGELLDQVLDAGVRRIVIGLGGSASTDAGTGALRALGARLLNDHGRDLPRGGGSLSSLARIDTTDLRPPPPEGVELLTDVTNPLCGPAGAAAVFGPQKGASPRDVDVLEESMRRVREVVGAADGPGRGAAGGAAYGLAALWSGRIVPGADRMLDAACFDAEAAEADLVITGEGSFDRQSLDGKLVGTVLRRARRTGTTVVVVSGRVEAQAARGVTAVSLSALAGSSQEAMRDTARWLRVAVTALTGCGPVDGVRRPVGDAWT